MSRQIRTRYAPSPTGFQHMGGIRTALFCYLYTRKVGGKFILRIEDTDRSRFVPGAEEYIVESLKWCGIECDEGPHVGGEYEPYRQSERKHLYRQYVNELLESGHAYYAFDTPEELAAERERQSAKGNHVWKYDIFTRMDMKNSLSLSAEEVQLRLERGDEYVVRIKIPEGERIGLTDVVRGEVYVNTAEMDDKVLLKADGMPTYHMANVVDDHLMQITHVIRGEEWLSSTPLHVLLYRSLGWEATMPTFAHLPLILKPEGKGKLGKRDGDKHGFPVFPLAWQHPTRDESSTGFREIGFLPQAFINMLAFLGWNPGTERELFSMEELIPEFEMERIGKPGVRFSFDKAKWFNEQYIKACDDKTLASLVLPFAPDGLKNIETDFLEKACSLMKDRMSLLTDFWEKGGFLFNKPAEYDAKPVRKKWKPEREGLFDDLRNKLSALETFDAANIEQTVRDFVTDSGIGFGNVMQILRIMLAGTLSGPSVYEMMELLGKAEVTDRMSAGAKAFNQMHKATKE